jgi:hypothetical protein
MPARVDAAALADFWEAVAATSDRFMADMLTAGGRSHTREFLHVFELLSERAVFNAA